MAAPERRATVFPGSSTVQLPSKRPAEGPDASTRLSASKIPRVQDFLKEPQRPHPPALPVKAKSDSNQYRHRHERVLAAPKARSAILRGNPWERYRAILKESPGETVTLAHEIDSKHEVVAIREQKCTDSGALKRLTLCRHANLVTLHVTFLHEDVLSFVYEPMEVSLAEIQSTPLGALEAYQIAAICAEVGSVSASGGI